jgi:hypothetical protein
VVPCPYNVLAGEVFYRLNGRLISAQQDKCKSHSAVLKLLLCVFRAIQFEILTDMTMKIRSSVGLSLLLASVVSCMAYFFTLKMKLIYSSKSLDFLKTTGHENPEGYAQLFPAM